MKKHGSLKNLSSLTLILTVTISTLPTSASAYKELVVYNPINQDRVTLLADGTKICSQNNYLNSRSTNLTLGDTAYISVNQTVTLVFESPCLKKNHTIMFLSKIGHSQNSWKQTLLLEFTTDGLVIKSENKIEYFVKDLMEMNSEIREGVNCSYNMKIHMLFDFNGRFMDKCDLDSLFVEKYVDLCNIYSGNYKKSSAMVQYSETSSSILKEKIVIKPVDTAVIIKTKFCNEQVHTTQFNPRDFVNDLNVIEKWFRFEYNVNKLIFSSSISISISGIQVDYWNYNDPECDEEPKFTLYGANDIKRICFNYENDLIEGPAYTTNHYDNNNYYERRVINFPYLIIIIMIILGKAICGYGVYKRRQARLITFTTRRIINNFEDVSHVGSNVITIVSSNQQSGSQSRSQRQPSEDLPPAYNDLQNTESNPPGYEDACKNKSFSPPGYEDACRDNIGFQTDVETSTSSNEPESMVVNQISTNNPSASQH